MSSLPLKYVVRWLFQGAGVGVGLWLVIWATEINDIAPTFFAMGMGAVLGRASR